MTFISKRSPFRFFSELFAIKFGIFLILDALFIHALTFNYAKLGLAWLDPYISHAYWGVALVVLGFADLYYTR